MDKAKKAKWIEALKSGKFRQGIGRLRMPDYNGKILVSKYCCLGVGVEIGIFEPAGSSNQKKIYIRNDDLPRSIQNDLAQRNDSGSDFNEIADYIERTL